MSNLRGWCVWGVHLWGYFLLWKVTAGGVCPFGIKEGITVYLDESLKRFETVYPAAGNDHSAVRLTIAELEDVAGACGWIDVCKEILL